MKKTLFILFVFLGLISSVLSAHAGPIAEASPYVEELYQKAIASHFETSLEWRNLVHYKPNFFSGYESQVDGLAFFLAPNGKDDPAAELHATLNEMFADPVTGDDHAQCRFPARLLLLTKTFNIDSAKLPHVSCPKYEDFEKKLSARSVALVFSSFYLNNPSSAFGHSFLRINSTRSVGMHGEHHELLDHGINFAAEVTTANPILFAFYGSIGVFKGTFTNVPYYYKVREYNDYDSRDLWSYDLNLTPEELTMLVAHIWELGTTYYDYFYFTENCSYHMFTTIEAAAPRLHLTDELPFYVIPSDTMRAVMRIPGLVSQVTYRPSVRSQFEYRLKTLTPEEHDALLKIVSEQRVDAMPASISKESQARILDAASDYMEFKYPKDLVKWETDSAKLKRQVLLTRAQLGGRSEDLTVPTPEDERPDRANGIRRLTVQTGYEGDRGLYSQLGFRFALQDMLDPGVGYPKNSQIEFMNTNFRYQYKPEHFEVEDITVFRVTSLSPYTEFKHQASFRAELGFQRIYDHDCDRCGAGVFDGGIGITVQPFGSERISLFSFADARVDYSTAFFGSNARLGAGPLVGILANFSNDFRGILSGSYKYEVFSVSPNVYEAKAQLRYGLAKWSAVDFSETRYVGFFETAGSLMFYF